MKYLRWSTLVAALVLVLAVSLTACEKIAHTDQTADQQKVTESYAAQFELAKKQAEKVLADAQAKTAGGDESAQDSVQHAIDSAEKLVGELKASGGQAWEEKRPVVEAALKDLNTKTSDTASKIRLADFKPTTSMGKESPAPILGKNIPTTAPAKAAPTTKPANAAATQKSK